MTRAQQVLDTYPRDFNVDAKVLARTIDPPRGLQQHVHAVCRRMPVGVRHRVSRQVHSPQPRLRGHLRCHKPSDLAANRVRRERDAAAPRGMHRGMSQLRGRVREARPAHGPLSGVRRELSPVRGSVPGAADRDELKVVAGIAVVTRRW